MNFVNINCVTYKLVMRVTRKGKKKKERASYERKYGKKRETRIKEEMGRKGEETERHERTERSKRGTK